MLFFLFYLIIQIYHLYVFALNLNLNLAIGNAKYSSPLDSDSPPSSQLLINSIIELSIPIVPPEPSPKPKNPQDSNPQP